MLKILERNAKRGSDIVKQVLAFARGAEGEFVLFNPKNLIEEVSKILRDTLPKSIHVSLSMPDELPAIRGDMTQLYQVLMNICVNARDAMPTGGKLKISAEPQYLDESIVKKHMDAKPGSYLKISVSDTGTGIEQSILDKIFEPFFTTKELGHGTGLGLSTAMGIIRSHKGFITVYSQCGNGTQFNLYLPSVEDISSTKVSKDSAELHRGSGELILVVDDEESIRELATKTLRSFGYKVLSAADGTEAVAVYASQGEKISLVLLDMMMPYMDGPATIRALKKLNPAVKIVASSGLQTNIDEARLYGVADLIPKPYLADKLLQTLHGVLRSESRGSNTNDKF
jgi:two-component system, cell cycle sensor histidine kinase and response regulator CckA